MSMKIDGPWIQFTCPAGPMYLIVVSLACDQLYNMNMSA